MAPEIGYFAVLLAFFVSMTQSAMPFVAARRSDLAVAAFVDQAALAQFMFIVVAFASLIYAFVTSDFSVEVVTANSHTAKPLLYKISGVWGNHEGSMLLWVLILSLFGAAVAVFGRNLPDRLRINVLGVQGMVGCGFLAFIALTSNPFARLPQPPSDGNGLNPILQDPGLAIHPPFLYLGYVGFSMAFSFAVAALIDGKVDACWARWVRPWVLAAWCFLTIGITLGSAWAYYTLGWGGWWFWDPVENASFMPWIAGTALLHSALVSVFTAILVLVLTFGRNAFAAAFMAVAIWLVAGSLAALAYRTRLGAVPLATTLRLARTTPRAFYGLVIAHAGMGIAVAGITGMTSWATEKIEMLRPGQSLELSGYNLRLRSVGNVAGPNYDAERGTFDVTRNGRFVGQMSSERRFYPVREQQTTAAGIRTNLISNLYVAIGEPDGNGAWAVRFYYHPFMPWVWIGTLTMALGGFVSLSDRRLRVGVPQRIPRECRFAVPAE